jgi:FKBP-type peptidyl-prolyl cis-trans isomerase FkpA
MMNKLHLISLVAFLLFSCKEDETTVTPDNSYQEIEDYLKATGLDSVAIMDTSGSGVLYYVIEKQGTGDSIGSRLYGKAYYKGYYTDSTVFDESGGVPYGFELSKMIEGWQIGIPHFKEGAKGTIGQGAEGILIVPSEMGYKDGKVRIFDIKIDKYK